MILKSFKNIVCMIFDKCTLQAAIMMLISLKIHPGHFTYSTLLENVTDDAIAPLFDEIFDHFPLFD